MGVHHLCPQLSAPFASELAAHSQLQLFVEEVTEDDQIGLTVKLAQQPPVRLMMLLAAPVAVGSVQLTVRQAGLIQRAWKPNFPPLETSIHILPHIFPH